MRSQSLLLALTLGCLPPSAMAQVAALPPPYQGIYQPQGVDEVGLWREDDEAERQLAVSPQVIRDEQLTAYVKGVLCATVGEDRCNAVRVYILRVPLFNASMSPNGTMRVFSGLFLRVHNEAELGSVLAHEFGHFESRHNLEGFRNRRTGSDMLAWNVLLASTAPGYDAMLRSRNVELSIYGGLFRHSRNQERQADTLGIAYLNRSRLRPRSAAAVWETVMGEAEASARVRGLRRPDFRRIAFTASHPPEGERAVYLTALAAPDDGREDGADRYREALAPWMASFLEDQIKLNDFGGSDYLIEHIAEAGWTADLWFARGELYRTRGAQRDLANAVTFYQKAIDLNPELAPAFRGLGLSLLKIGRASEGRVALGEYLRLSPDAPDAGMIRMMAPTEDAQ